jgi:branched-chain amino acid transport system permease protein
MIEKSKSWRAILLSIIVASLIIPMVITESYHLHLVNITYIYIILALSLGLIVGFIGELSLGHAAFFAIGAYTSALITKDLGLSFWITLPIAIAFAAFIGFLVGYPSLKLKGPFFAITTLAFGEIIRLVINNLEELTRGAMGLPGIQPPNPITIPGLFAIDFYDRRAFYYLILLFVFITIIIIYRIIYSRVGRAFIAIREDEVLAKSIGINAMRYKIIAFVIASAMAGLAGCLYAHYFLFISPVSFDVAQSINVVLMVIIGGSNSILGPILGAFLITLLPEILRAIAEYRMVIYGAILVFAIIFMPEGIVGSISERVGHLFLQKEKK